MTFAQFQASGRPVDDLRAHVPDFFTNAAPGRIYPGQCWVEDTSTWPADAPGYGLGRWYTAIGNMEYQSDELPVVEWPLYEFASNQKA
jgi:hypothetical protein